MPVRLASRAVMLLLVAGPAAAQSPADTVRALNARMKADLRNLVTAQEAHFAQAASYAPSVAALGEGYRPSLGVTVEVVRGGPNGYGAVARTAGRAGSCTIVVGVEGDRAPRTDVEGKRAPEGEPICDGDGITERAAFAREAQARAAQALLRVSKLQERHFGRTGGYTADLAELVGLRLPATISVTLEVVPIPNREPVFLATATDSRYPGFSCVLASGWARFQSRASTLAEGKHAGGSSTAVCDTFQ